MADNQFTVDLGDVKMTEAQKTSMNAAIQSAVAMELTKYNLGNQTVLVPLGKFKGPIIYGLIARNLNIARFKEIIERR